MHSEFKEWGNIFKKRDTCSWKGQFERTRSWKALNWKFSLKLERVKRSWKEPIEVVKFERKLESTKEVGK